jgi:MOSC domain-containing protein
MTRQIGIVTHLFRYPVKSMAGVSVDAASLGWHGVEGDRRFGFRRIEEGSGFPWLTASRVPELILYRPFGETEGSPLLPSHVHTPDARDLPLAGGELRQDLSRRYGSAVELMRLSQGIFDEASVSVIASATIREIMGRSGQPIDPRRFRPNIVVEADDGAPFTEDHWVGKRLTFGAVDGAAAAVTQRDLRCVMINLDPETAESQAEVMKTAVRLNDNYAGIYATVVQTGELRVGQSVLLGEG